MKDKKKRKEMIPGAESNPFKVPESYFENFEARLAERISSESEEKSKVKRISLRPYFTLAASISGIALVTFMILQVVLGGRFDDSAYYDLSLLENAGIDIDESSISEIYNASSLDEGAAWDEDVMNYLASNEVELEYLLAMN